jgi:hypothetical protein
MCYKIIYHCSLIFVKHNHSAKKLSILTDRVWIYDLLLPLQNIIKSKSNFFNVFGSKFRPNIFTYVDQLLFIFCNGGNIIYQTSLLSCNFELHLLDNHNVFFFLVKDNHNVFINKEMRIFLRKLIYWSPFNNYYALLSPTTKIRRKLKDTIFNHIIIIFKQFNTPHFLKWTLQYIIHPLLSLFAR